MLVLTQGRLSAHFISEHEFLQIYSTDFSHETLSRHFCQHTVVRGSFFFLCSVFHYSIGRVSVKSKMAEAPGKNKLKMGNTGRYYGAYLIYDVANSCLAALHAKVSPTMPALTTATLTPKSIRSGPPVPVHVQNPRKFDGIIIFLFSRPIRCHYHFRF